MARSLRGWLEAYEADTDELLDDARAAIVAHEEQTDLTNDANADQQRDANGG
jgi:hypothetical protein